MALPLIQLDRLEQPPLARIPALRREGNRAVSPTQQQGRPRLERTTEGIDKVGMRKHPEGVPDEARVLQPVVREDPGNLLVGGEVPEPHRAVRPGRGQHVPAGREGHGIDPAPVPGQGLTAGRAVEVPEPHRAVRPGRGQHVPAGHEGHGKDPALVPGQGLTAGRAVEVPEPHRAVRPGRGQHVPAGHEGHGKDPVPVPGQGLTARRTVEVPEPHRAVRPGRGQHVPAGREGHGTDPAWCPVRG